ncbi:helix-turn-helix domain-containing protein [Streptomyces zaomyceticus]|uniref:helix-turn-helix domain-containing protein n=1 Tax=Streptomyces zaomyceticus TaxID=68286 RepID=UPI00371AF9B8
MSKSEEQQDRAKKSLSALTINQVVSYNLARIRRSRGYTQDEAAQLLERASGKRWTSATLSAAERSVKTGRSKFFDANEIVTFARVFRVPLSYFFMPLETQEHEEVTYFQFQPSLEEGAGMTEPLLEEKALLELAVPLRYPSELVDRANRVWRRHGLNWEPGARVEYWNEAEEAYHDAQAEEYERENPRALPPEDMESVQRFAALLREQPPHLVYKALSETLEGMEAPGWGEEVPF